MGWMQGLLSGYLDRHHELQKEARADAELRAEREGKIYSALLSHEDPEIQQMAATGILQLGEPRRQKRGMQAFIGDVTTSEIYPTLKKYFETPQYRKLPTTASVTTGEQYHLDPTTLPEEAKVPGQPSVPASGSLATPPPTAQSAALPAAGTTTPGAPAPASTTPAPPPPPPSPSPSPASSPGSTASASRAGGPGGLPPSPFASGFRAYTPGPTPTSPETSVPVSGFRNAAPGSGRMTETLPPPAPSEALTPGMAPPPPQPLIPGTAPASPADPAPSATSVGTTPPEIPADLLAERPPLPERGERVFPRFPSDIDLAAQKTKATQMAEIQGDTDALTWAFQQQGDDPQTARQKAVKAVAEEFVRGRAGASQLYIKGGRVPNPKSPTGWSREMVLRTDPSQKQLINEEPPSYLNPMDAGEKNTTTLRLRDQWAVTSRKAREALGAVDAMKAAYGEFQANGKLPPTAEVVTVLFQKALDPDSVVRETEANRPGQFQPFLAWAQGKLEQFRFGGGIIRAQDLPDYIRIAEVIAQAAAMRVEDEGKLMEKYATQIGIDPQYIRPGPLVPPGTSVLQPPTGPPPAPPPGTTPAAPAAPTTPAVTAPATPAVPTPTTPAPQPGTLPSRAVKTPSGWVIQW